MYSVLTGWPCDAHQKPKPTMFGPISWGVTLGNCPVIIGMLSVDIALLFGISLWAEKKYPPDSWCSRWALHHHCSQKLLSLSSTFRRFWRSLVRPTNCETNTRSSSKDAWMKECTVHALQGQVGALGRLIEDDFFSLKVISEVHPKIKASV